MAYYGTLIEVAMAFLFSGLGSSPSGSRRGEKKADILLIKVNRVQEIHGENE